MKRKLERKGENIMSIKYNSFYFYAYYYYPRIVCFN